MTTITDADREAARTADIEYTHLVEAFARHREAALEEAARVAEHIASCAFSEGMSEDVTSARYYTAHDIATAIRALKGNNDAG